jgi:hypothetical protein
MNSQIEERIEIIDDFFINTGNNQLKSKSQNWLLRFHIVYHILFCIFLLYVIFISFCALIYWNPFYEKWVKTGLLVSLAFISILNNRLPLITHFLNKHLKIIQVKDVLFNSELNVELENFLNGISERRFKPYYIGIPVLVIAIAGLIQHMTIHLSSNPEFIYSVWYLFPFPVFVFSIWLLLHINRQIWLVRKNIKVVQASI